MNDLTQVSQQPSNAEEKDYWEYVVQLRVRSTWDKNYRDFLYDLEDEFFNPETFGKDYRLLTSQSYHCSKGLLEKPLEVYEVRIGSEDLISQVEIEVKNHNHESDIPL